MMSGVCVGSVGKGKGVAVRGRKGTSFSLALDQLQANQARVLGAIEEGKAADRKVFDECFDVIEQVVYRDAKLEDATAASKIAAFLVKLLQRFLVWDQKQLALDVGVRGLKILLFLSELITFKNPLSVETMGRKIATCYLECKAFRYSIEVFELVIVQLVKRGLVVSPINEGHETSILLLELSPGKDEALRSKIVQLVAIGLYNAIRCFVELEEFDTSLSICNVNLVVWLELLKEEDIDKTIGVGKSAMALLYHHTGSLLDKRGKTLDAFTFRVCGLKMRQSSYVSSCNKENDTIWQLELLTQVLGASTQLLRGSGDELDDFRQRVIYLYESCWSWFPLPSLKSQSTVSLSEQGMDPEFTMQLVTFIEHFASLSVENIEYSRAATILTCGIRFLKSQQDQIGLLSRAFIMLSAFTTLVKWSIASASKKTTAPNLGVHRKSLLGMTESKKHLFLLLANEVDRCLVSVGESKFETRVLTQLGNVVRYLHDIVSKRTKYAVLEMSMEVLANLQSRLSNPPNPSLAVSLRIISERRLVANAPDDITLQTLACAMKFSDGHHEVTKRIGSASYNIGAGFFNSGDYANAVPFLRLSLCPDHEGVVNDGRFCDRLKVLAACLSKLRLTQETQTLYTRIILNHLKCGQIPNEEVALFSRAAVELWGLGESRTLVSMAKSNTILDDDTIATLTRLELDQYMLMAARNWQQDDQETTDSIYELQKQSLETLRDVEESSVLFEVVYQTERTRLAWFRCLQRRTLETIAPDINVKLLGEELRDLEQLETSDDAESQLLSFWKGVVESSISPEKGPVAPTHALQIWEQDAASLCHKNYRLAQDLQFVADWCEYVGLHSESFRTNVILLQSSKNLNESTLLRAALVSESEIGSPLLGQKLYRERQLDKDDLYSLLVSVKFFHYDLCASHEVSKVAMELENNKTFGYLLSILEEKLEDISQTETTGKEHAPTCHFLFASLLFWQRHKSTEALEHAEKALKLTISASTPSQMHSFSMGGFEWDQTNLLADCLTLVGRIHHSRGDPRSARFYFNKGKELAERVGSFSLMNRFAFLHSNIAASAMRLDDAQVLLDNMSSESGKRYKLEFLICNIELMIKRGLAADANELIEHAAAVLESMVEQVETQDNTTFSDPTLEEDSTIGKSMFLLEANVSLMLCRAKSLLLEDQGSMDAMCLLERSSEKCAETPLLYMKKAESLMLQAGIHIYLHTFVRAQETLESIFEFARGFANPELNRQLFRSLAFVNMKIDENPSGHERTVNAYLLQASFGLALSLHRGRLMSDSGGVGALHFPHSISLDRGVQGFSSAIDRFLPKNCAVCSICLMEKFDTVIITRISGDLDTPVNVSIPLKGSTRDLVGRFSKLIEEAEATTKGLTSEAATSWDRAKKRKWVDQRKCMDEEVQELLMQFEEEWFGVTKVLLQPARKVVDFEWNPETSALLSKCERYDVVNFIANNSQNLDTADIKNCLVCIARIQDKDLVSRVATEIRGFHNTTTNNSSNLDPPSMKVVELRAALATFGLPTKGLKKDLIQRLEAHLLGCEESEDEDEDEENDAYTVLILSEQLQQIPFESMPSLRDKTVTRMPSFAFVLERLSKGVSSPNIESGAFIIDPRGDLPSTQKAFGPFMNKVRKSFGWDGVRGVDNTDTHSGFMKQSLQDKDIVLYCGHGSGEDLLSREQLCRFPTCASTLLMGCSSGKLHSQGVFEPVGIVFAYVLAGCPAVVGNLWDVTDKDIDRFTLSTLDSWLFSENRSSLATAVASSRDACKLGYLVGAAPVCIGLPVPQPARSTR